MREKDLFTQNASDKTVAQVYETTDYDKFKILYGNRETDHVKRLKKSFEEKLIPNAIIVNEKYEIIDGQNRFKALKEMGKPVWYYMVPGLNIYDVALLNQYAKNWTQKDYVRMYSKLGVPAYKTIEEFSSKYQELGLSNCLIILSFSAKKQSGCPVSDAAKRESGNIEYFKTGKFVIKDIDKSTEIADAIMQYKNIQGQLGTPVFRHVPFVVTMSRLLKDNKFDNAEMLKKAQKFPQLFYRCINGDGYIDMLETLYNYCRRGEKVRFK